MCISGWFHCTENDKETKIYECEVNADGGYESANKALELPDQWELIDYNKESIGAQLRKEGIRDE